MKVKLDENLGNRSIELFKEHGHEVATVSEQNLGGVDDAELIAICKEEGRVLVTLDLDFSTVLRFPPKDYASIVVLRVPHPIELETIHERVRVLLRAPERKHIGTTLDRRARPDTRILTRSVGPAVDRNTAFAIGDEARKQSPASICIGSPLSDIVLDA